jgi:hypothetical protein
MQRLASQQKELKDLIAANEKMQKALKKMHKKDKDQSKKIESLQNFNDGLLSTLQKSEKRIVSLKHPAQQDRERGFKAVPARRPTTVNFEEDLLAGSGSDAEPMSESDREEAPGACGSGRSDDQIDEDTNAEDEQQPSIDE